MEYNSKQLQIIGVAEKMFAAKGFSGTSIRDISQEADINVSMISYYFGSKEKLIEALFKVRAKEFLNRLDALLLNEDLSPLQRVYLMIDGILERMTANHCFHNIVLREQLATSSRTPVIYDLLLGMKINNLRAMESIIEDGQKQGVFRENVDVLMLSSALFGTINHILSTKPFYRKINGLEHLDECELEKEMKQKLAAHLKKVFKVTLSPELNGDVES